MKVPGLRTWRELRGLTQAELAERAGTSQDAISRMESGSRGASPHMLASLSRALEVDPRDLALDRVEVLTGPKGEGLPEGPVGDLRNFLRYATSQTKQAERGDLTGSNRTQLALDLAMMGRAAMQWADAGEVERHEAAASAKTCLELLDRLVNTSAAELEQARRAEGEVREVYPGEIPSAEAFGTPTVERRIEELAERVRSGDLAIEDALRELSEAS